MSYLYRTKFLKFYLPLSTYCGTNEQKRFTRAKAGGFHKNTMFLITALNVTLNEKKTVKGLL